MKVVFINYSTSGIDRTYIGLRLAIPGATDFSAPSVVTLNVPDDLIADVELYLSENYPAISFQVLEEEDVKEVVEDVVKGAGKVEETPANVENLTPEVTESAESSGSKKKQTPTEA